MTNPLETNTGRTGEGSIKEQLHALCAAYLASDQWGRNHTMTIALGQAAKHPAESARKLRLVSQAGLDQQAHLLDDVINSLPLAIIR
jgi:hypothetical protein